MNYRTKALLCTIASVLILAAAMIEPFIFDTFYVVKGIMTIFLVFASLVVSFAIYQALCCFFDDEQAQNNNKL